MEDKYLLFRLVPTMKCNYRCSYCFVPGEEKRSQTTIFDQHGPEEWIRAMGKFRDYEVEFYCWGGEPFLLDGTYDIVKGWTSYDHVISGSRLDTNMAFTDRIVERCPTDKVKLNCSWHTQYDTLQQMYSKVAKLNEAGMVGMVNFVASKSNLEVLTKEYQMTVDDLIAKFQELDVFVNVAADFRVVNDRDPGAYKEYRNFILKYQCPEDWKQLRCEKSPCLCEANHHFFTLHPNGDITPCISGRVCGNFFDGWLEFPECSICYERCPSLVAYPFRTDNGFPYKQHLVEYVKRNREYRESVRTSRGAATYDIGSVLKDCVVDGGLSDSGARPVSSKPLSQTNGSRMPRVSVILPTYNHLRFLPGAVQSVLAQTFTDFELIVVNDGSTDGTKGFLEGLEDPRIHVIHQENQRLPRALNAGFDVARGELLTWVSSDNYCAPIFLEALVGALDAYPAAGFAYSAFAWIDDEDRILGVMRDQDISRHVLLALNPNVAAFMYRRACQELVGPYDPDLDGAEDWDMWLRITEHFQIVYVPEILYYYRTHARSMTAEMPEKVRQACRRTFCKALKRMGDEVDLVKLYPAISQCRDQEAAAFHALFDFGTRLLNVQYDANEEACDFLETALSLRPDAFTVAGNLAVAYGRSGQWGKAIGLVQKLRGLDHPQLSVICSTLDKAYREQKPELLCSESLLFSNAQSEELFQIMRRQKSVFSLSLTQVARPHSEGLHQSAGVAA